VKIANAGMQIFGGAGYSMEFDMQRHFRDSRARRLPPARRKCSAT
jgi:alkylation response protein AidB-like acyl-CoA dehydrogenase